MSNLTTQINIKETAKSAKSNIVGYVATLQLSDEVNNIVINDIEDEKNQFYFCYTSLFIEEADAIIDSLNIAGYFYFKYLIATDSLVDTTSNTTNLFKHLICSDFYHEETIRLLSTIFNKYPEFWNYWNVRKAEYLSAFKTDKKFLTSLTDTEFHILADNKSANGKVAIDSLFIIGTINNKEYEALLCSHKLFSCGFQYYDDVLDIKQDIINRQTNIALCELRKIISSEMLIEMLTHPDKIVSLIYVNGTASALLKKSIVCFEEAENAIEFINCSLWKQVIKGKKKEVRKVLDNVEFYMQTLKIKTRLSSNKIEIGNNIKINIEHSLLLGINFIAKEQEKDGSWKDYPVNARLSDYWTTGYVLNAIANCDKKLIDSLNISRAIKYLHQKNSTMWSFIEGCPDDADSTNFALLALIANQQIAYDELNQLLSYQQKDGGFSTYNNPQTLLDYFDDPNIKDVTGWTQSHVCVSAGTLLLLSKLKGFDEAKYKLINYLLQNISENNLWNSYWWTSPIYSTSLIIEAATTLNNTELNDAAENAATELLTQQQKNGLFADAYSNKQIFYSSLVLNSLCSNEKLFVKHRDQIVILANAIIENQNEDGSWDSSYALRVPATDCINPEIITKWKKSDLGLNVIVEDIHRIFTTSTAIRALSRYEQCKSI